MMIKALLFDVSGVLTHADFGKVYSALSKDLGIDESLFKEYQKANLDQQLNGHMLIRDTYNDFTTISANLSYEEYTQKWIECILRNTTLNTEMINWIDLLRYQYRCGILTNNNEHRHVFDKKIGLYAHFDFVIESFKAGFKKPDIQFFQLGIEAAKCNPENIIFIDDQERHVNAAKELGINGLKYVDNPTLRTQFAKFGVQIIEE